MIPWGIPNYTVQKHAIKLTAAAEKSIRAKHPWVFESSIVKQGKDVRAGDIAIIFSKNKNKLIAVGLMDPNSPIRIKVVSFQAATLNQSWFTASIQAAFDKRRALLKDNTSFRLIFGENDLMPSLIVDIYEQVAVVKYYALIWLPYHAFIIQGILDLNTSLCEYNRPIQAIVLRLSRQVDRALESYSDIYDGKVVYGTLDNPVVRFREYGVDFSAHVIRGHKTGYFLDHRQNRRQIGLMSKDKTVLDVFSYAGGFSVHALVGGATSVTSVDISQQALDLAKENAALNGTFSNHICLQGDAFAIMKDLIQQAKRYDIVVVDPPSFAKQAKEIDTAINSYKRLCRLAVQLTAKNGLILLASCSSRIQMDVFRELNESCLKRQSRRYQIVDETLHDIDHPVNFPEGLYLKSLYVRLD